MQRDEAESTKKDEPACLLRGHLPIIPGELMSAREQAEDLLREACEESERILATARSEADAGVRLAACRAKRAQEKKTAVQLASLHRWAKSYREALREEMIAAVLTVAERVWGELCESRPRAAALVAAELREELAGSGKLLFRAHPDDEQELEKLGLDVEPDPSLRSGDCVVERDGVVHDARAEVRAAVSLAALKEALVGGISEEAHDEG